MEETTGIPPARQECAPPVSQQLLRPLTQHPCLVKPPLPSLTVRHGYPPKLLDPAAPPETSLKSLGITSGEAFVVSEGSAEPAASTSSSFTSSAQRRTVSPAVVPSAAPSRAQQPVAPPKPQAAGSGGQYIETGGGFLCLRVVPDDNSCLFRAVGLVLSPGETDAAASLRRVVAGAIQADPETYSEAMLGCIPFLHSLLEVTDDPPSTDEHLKITSPRYSSQPRGAAPSSSPSSLSTSRPRSAA